MSFSTATRLVTAGTVAAGLALSGTLGAGAAPRASTSCGTGCTVVSRADIDGDGRADATSITRLNKGKTHVLRTVTATGKAASARIATPWLMGNDPFEAAVPMDGARGSEVVVATGVGAHTQFFAVYSWRQGRLVAQKDPSGSTEWVTDGALSSSMGYTLRTVKGTRQLTQISLTRDSWSDRATFSGTRTTARWENGHWRPITVRGVKIPESRAVRAGAGWNVPGMERF